jgi:geranylgeranyl diphosphate synthase, type I
MASKIAAIVAEADEDLVTAIGKLAESLGVVFQIQDDILNITENDLSKMKGLGEDITEGKKSLPVILALHNLSDEKFKRLLEILLMHTTDNNLIAEAIGLIKVGQGIEKAKVIMQTLFDQAWNKLDQLLPDNDKKSNLYNLAHFLIERNV